MFSFVLESPWFRSFIFKFLAFVFTRVLSCKMRLHIKITIFNANDYYGHENKSKKQLRRKPTKKQNYSQETSLIPNTNQCQQKMSMTSEIFAKLHNRLNLDFRSSRVWMKATSRQIFLLKDLSSSSRASARYKLWHPRSCHGPSCSPECLS